jgi:hypothetical protein
MMRAPSTFAAGAAGAVAGFSGAFEQATNAIRENASGSANSLGAYITTPTFISVVR